MDPLTFDPDIEETKPHTSDHFPIHLILAVSFQFRPRYYTELQCGINVILQELVPTAITHPHHDIFQGKRIIAHRIGQSGYILIIKMGQIFESIY